MFSFRKRADEASKSPVPSSDKKSFSHVTLPVSVDITPLITQFPPAILYRVILGYDGRNQIQTRQGVTLCQFELDGRPDGEPSALAQWESEIDTVPLVTGNTRAYTLPLHGQAELVREFDQYFMRAKALHTLGDLKRELRDINHLIRIFERLTEFGPEALEPLDLGERLRDAITRNTRAYVDLALELGEARQALRYVGHGASLLDSLAEAAGHACWGDDYFPGLRETILLSLPPGASEWQELVREELAVLESPSQNDDMVRDNPARLNAALAERNIPVRPRDGGSPDCHQDLRLILRDWGFRPGYERARDVVGQDERHYFQLRCDLGVSQLAARGHPSGKTFEGFESLLEVEEKRQEEFIDANAETFNRFRIPASMCQKLGGESYEYYLRYKAAFVLNQWDVAIQDARRNYRALMLVDYYGEPRKDQREQTREGRGRVIGMLYKAKTQKLLAEGKPEIAWRVARTGMRRINKAVRQGRAVPTSDFSLLRELAEACAKRMPSNSPIRLRQELRDAIRQQEFEKAAKIRDRLAELADRD